MNAFTQHHKNLLVRQLEAALICVKDMPVSRSCHDCLYADMGGKPLRCRLANAYPPAEVIATGCEMYVFNSNDVPL